MFHYISLYEIKKDIMKRLDFVIPVKCNNFIIRTVIECVTKHYRPRNIYIITSPECILEIANQSRDWFNVVQNEMEALTEIIYIDETQFFKDNYGLSKADIESMYTCIDEKSREFGWWYQQLLKLGSVKQIPDLSDPYVVWDSDLVSLEKWDIYPTPCCDNYRFAILQESAKNDWNKQQYAASIKELIRLDALEPETGGTFVPHHFVFHHRVIHQLLDEISTSRQHWIERIMTLSATYYRYSEYKCVATYMATHFPELLHYHDFNTYGKTGIRYRECEKIAKLIQDQCQVSGGLSYIEFCSWVNNNNNFPATMPSYIQIEHLT